MACSLAGPGTSNLSVREPRGVHTQHHSSVPPRTLPKGTHGLQHSGLLRTPVAWGHLKRPPRLYAESHDQELKSCPSWMGTRKQGQGSRLVPDHQVSFFCLCFLHVKQCGLRPRPSQGLQAFSAQLPAEGNGAGHRWWSWWPPVWLLPTDRCPALHSQLLQLVQSTWHQRASRSCDQHKPACLHHHHGAKIKLPANKWPNQNRTSFFGSLLSHKDLSWELAEVCGTLDPTLVWPYRAGGQPTPCVGCAGLRLCTRRQR